VRAVLIVVTGVLVLALAGIAVRWAFENFVPSPVPIEVPADAPIRHPGYEAMAERALRRFAELPAEKRREVEANLRESLSSLDDWLAALRQRRLELLCIGEHHEETTRRFLAERVFPYLPIDVLMLEATSIELERIVETTRAGLAHVPLLGADVSGVIRAARRRNSSLALAPIEESESQREHRMARGDGSRDRSIADNFRSHLRRGKRHAVLFGALHCTDQTGWLFTRIARTEHRIDPNATLNVNVLGSHQDGTLEAFLFFMHEIGVQRTVFAIPETSALHPAVYEWFPPLTRSFGRFRAAVVFDEDAFEISAVREGG